MAQHGNDISIGKKKRRQLQSNSSKAHLFRHYAQVKMKFVLKLETKLKFKRFEFLEEGKRLRINELVKIKTQNSQEK